MFPYPVMSSEKAMDALEREVARELTPTPEFSLNLREVQRRLLERAMERAKGLGYPLARALVAGSAARETYLPSNFDIDLFLLFDPSLSREKMVEGGLALGHELLKNPVKKYAEHPYLRGFFEAIPTEVIPGYAVKSADHPITAVDRTPFHNDHLLSRHTEGTRSEVRLLKQFLRSLGIYGAEVKTEGFSGYLVELLTLRAGSFRKLLMEVAGWRLPQRLTPPGKEPSVEANSALVLSDPVDPHRNVSAALSRQNLALFILASQAYLTNARRAFFFPIPRASLAESEITELSAKRGTTVVALLFPIPQMVPDVLYPQLRKSERSLVTRLTETGFRVVGSASAAEEGEGAILVETEESEVGPVRIAPGPPVGLPEITGFLEKWGRLGSLQGPYVTPEGHLRVETAEKVRSLTGKIQEVIPSLSLGRDLKVEVEKRGKVLPLSAVFQNRPVRLALELLWRKRLPWLDWE